MKIRWIQTSILSLLVVFAAVLNFSSFAVGQSTTPPCSNRTLQGDYAFSIEGAVLRGVAVTHFDGEGNLTQVDHVVINGVPPTTDWRPGVGTYTVNPDCTGSAEITSAGRTVHLRLVLARHGTEIRTVVTDPGTMASSLGVKR